ncbi:hypothetical protein ACFL12_01010 [Pseudomonadota bacterium]
MPYSSCILTEDELIVSHGSGLIKPAEMFDAIAALKKMPDYRPDLDRLIIIDDDASVPDIDLDALRTFKEKLHHETPSPLRSEALEKPLVFRAAIACNNPQNTGITALYVTMLKFDPTVEATFEHFLTVDDALAWLGKPKAALPQLT